MKLFSTVLRVFVPYISARAALRCAFSMCSGASILTDEDEYIVRGIAAESPSEQCCTLWRHSISNMEAFPSSCRLSSTAAFHAPPSSLAWPMARQVTKQTDDTGRSQMTVILLLAQFDSIQRARCVPFELYCPAFAYRGQKTETN